MKWYRQRLGLSLNHVEALTGIDRAHMRRVERRRTRLSLVLFWRWSNEGDEGELFESNIKYGRCWTFLAKSIPDVSR